MGSERGYIDNLKFKDIPWNRMTTAYGTAEKFPEFFAVLEKMQNIEEMDDAFYSIMGEVEHQDSLYQPLPFVIIFFKRLLKKAESIHTPESEWLMEEIKENFKGISKICDYVAYEFPHGNQLWHFSELLDEKYLIPQSHRIETDNFDYEYSVVYYAKKILNEDF